MFQNVFMDPKILKEKQFFLFFECFLESLSFFNFLNLIFVSFQFHTHVYMYFHRNVNMCYFI